MKLSVILPVYNGERYLSECLDSLIAQTFTDFEVIAVDDGSTDSSYAILSRYAALDARIKPHQLSQNQGEPNAVRTALALANGEYIARMDQDDICHPDRFKQQVAYLDESEQTVVVGSNLELFGSVNGFTNVPQKDAQIKAKFIHASNFLANSSTMWKINWMRAKNIEYGNLANVSDFGYWVDCMRHGGQFANLELPLVKYRTHENQASYNVEAQEIGMTTILTRVVSHWFPLLTEAEHKQIINISYSLTPKPLTLADIEAAFRAINKAKQYKEALFGEDRSMVFGFFDEKIKLFTDLLRQQLPDYQFKG